ncbi:Rho GTPase activating protein [Tritrichomonas foetus]|uniref:Rho GTPase activating protein n=1 Tax=Tritrichomonas foetus TaxID=1144522 RepID=A0A1J4JI65_9EUKA|nr:Rho GTPase activating protein [Tritrichomonas foetus]|eukprot:OHS97991.1 Rho GTPase activating protein [Tritrichomonas foetus]
MDIESTGNLIGRFYACKSFSSDKYFFHNPITNETTWNLPRFFQEILSAETMLPFDISDYKIDYTNDNSKENVNITEKNDQNSQTEDEINTSKMKDNPEITDSKDDSIKESTKKISSLDSDNFNYTNDFGREFMTLQPSFSTHTRTTKRRKTKNKSLLENFQESTFSLEDSPIQKEIIEYLPPSIKADKDELISFRDFALLNFNLKIKKSKNKKITIDDIITADLLPKNIPLLKKSYESKINVKTSQKIYDLIIHYSTTQNKTNKPNESLQIVHLIQNNLNLIDETFMELFKQVNGNTSVEASNQIWDLILILSTIFVSSPLTQKVIRSFLATKSFVTNKNIASKSQLCYIRFLARCITNENIQRKITDNFILSIPNHINDNNYTQGGGFSIGASIYELFFHQRRKNPNLRIPLFLHKICEKIIQCNNKNPKEGIFKLPGNKLSVDKMVDDLDTNQFDFNNEDYDVFDLASLLKRFLGEMPESLINEELVEEIKSKKNYIEIVERLGTIQRNTLGYIVGFLKKFLTISNIGLTPLSMTFGTNIMRVNSIDPMKIKELTEVAKIFMSNLIETWDVSFIYPIDI